MQRSVSNIISFVKSAYMENKLYISGVILLWICMVIRRDHDITSYAIMVNSVYDAGKQMFVAGKLDC